MHFILTPALLDIADYKENKIQSSPLFGDNIEHSLPEVLSIRDRKGFNYRQVDLKSPSGGDLRLQFW